MQLIKKTRREIRISRNGKKLYVYYCLAKCHVCGKLKEINRGHLKILASCGCLEEKRLHGDTKARLYNVWVKMKQRCTDSKSHAYKRYGGRGISICDQWMDYRNFKKWATNNGYSDKLQIDRINNDGNYEPGNCRFVTGTVNMRNTSVNKLTWVKVDAIRDFCKDRDVRFKEMEEIGALFDVSFASVYDVINYRTWRKIS